MDLYLQLGYGMMGHSQHLVENWEGGTVILSPRDLDLDQMNRFTSKIHDFSGQVLVDPQFYMPRADHDRLVSHPYWPADYSTALFNSTGIRAMLKELKEQYNDPFESPFFILPGIRSSEINDDWFKINSLIISEANEMAVHASIYMTLCLSQEAMLSENAIHDVLEYLETWNIAGCYVVPEPPNNSYLVNNPNWIVNLLDLSAGIKLQNKRVLVGYTNHQLLCLGLAKTDAIASGNWLNVRSFNINKFNSAEDGISRRSTWYYCPQSLSEYQIPFLDIASRFGILNDLRTDVIFGSNYSDILFSGAQPSNVNYTDNQAFRHYLHCLKRQTNNSVRASYNETREALRIQLETAEQLTSFFNSQGIRGRDRDFSNVVDVNLSALDVFDGIRGMVLEHRWDSIN